MTIVGWISADHYFVHVQDNGRGSEADQHRSQCEPEERSESPQIAID